MSKPYICKSCDKELETGERCAAFYEDGGSKCRPMLKGSYAGWIGPVQKGPDSQDMVNSPPHYNQGEIECLDAMISAYGLEAVQLHAHLCAFKYLWRAGRKGSEGSQDFDKAVFYTRFANGDDPRKD